MSATRLYSQTEEGIAALSPMKTQGHSLGIVRETSVDSLYNIAPLLLAARLHSNAVFNPNESTGCSPTLRALLVQTGAAHSIVNEVSSDGQTYGHQGGNAIDIGPGSPANFFPDMRMLVTLLRPFSALFSCVAYTDTEIDQFSYYVWNGVEVAASGMSGVGGVLFTDQCTNKMHVASSSSRIFSTLYTNTTIRAIFAGITTDINHRGSDRMVFTTSPTFSETISITEQQINTRW